MTPPVEGALFRAAFVASCLRGAFPPVDLRAVCFVRAIFPHSPTETSTRDTGARLSPSAPRPDDTAAKTPQAASAPLPRRGQAASGLPRDGEEQ